MSTLSMDGAKLIETAYEMVIDQPTLFLDE
jgi:hypothetical protein